MRVIVFDTETVGKVSQALLNVGYQILDIDIQNATAKVLQKRNFLVGSLFKNEMLMLNDDFVGAKKYGFYKAMLDDKKIVFHEIPTIFRIMENDLKRHAVLFGYAFNSAFDTDKFDRTATEKGLRNPLANIPIFDLWGFAYDRITNTEEYKAWAKANEQYTSTGRYLSGNVEAITRYLLNNLDFAESHTALDDTEHEVRILLECVRRGADITREVKHGNLPSDKVFEDIYVDTETGEVMTLRYKKLVKRNGATYLYH